MDKNKELAVSVRLINDKLKFAGQSGDLDPVTIDYIAPLGDDQGYTSLELLLLSLSSCFGSALLVFLRRMNKKITRLEILVKGVRKQEHPTGFETIDLHIDLDSPDLQDEELKKVIDLAEEKYCPVWSMMKGNTHLEISHSIH
jgi:putative redox protein